jgi:hypothetical protein
MQQQLEVEAIQLIKNDAKRLRFLKESNTLALMSKIRKKPNAKGQKSKTSSHHHPAFPPIAESLCASEGFATVRSIHVLCWALVRLRPLSLLWSFRVVWQRA